MIKPLDIAKINSYVAIGDSFSEGMMDPGVDTDFRGWTDRLASKLSRIRVDAGLPEVDYANLAVRGKLLSQIVKEQLKPALELKPDLLSLVGGGNDMLRPGATPDSTGEMLEAAVSVARKSGCEVLLAVSSNAYGGSKLISTTRGQTSIFNSYIWSIAHRYDCYVVDQWGLAALRTWKAWAPDRIHLTPTGHEIVAREAARSLGIDTALDESQQIPAINEDEIPTNVPISEAVPAGWDSAHKSLKDDAQWMRKYVVPWIGRRLRGTSSGDGVLAKRPRLKPMPPQETMQG